MRVLVIGGTGFIGPHVVDCLAERGHEVAVLSRGGPQQHTDASPGAVPQGDVRHIAGDRRQLRHVAPALRAFSPDVVIDLILSSGSQAQVLVDVFRGFTNRLVAASSMDVYRACGVLHRLEDGPLQPLPLTETSALRTKLQTYPDAQLAMLKGVFGWADDEYDKIPVEQAVLAVNDLPATVLRLPMVYGPRDKLHRFFPVLKRIVDRRPAILFAESTARWRGTKAYVGNVAEAIALAAVSDRAAGRTFNVGEEQTISELDWARRVATMCEWAGELRVVPDAEAPPHLRPRGNYEQHWVADSSTIRTELGFREPIPSDEALARTIAWQRANPPAQIDASQFDYAAEDDCIGRQVVK
jgi:nucleoside-diphosphate-sugar epimerase